MNLPKLKQQILVNRRILSGMYECLSQAKADKRQYDEYGDMTGEYEAHNYLTWLRKEIAKLVDLQKALKADVAWTLCFERANRE